MTISKDNWMSKWEQVQVTHDTPAAELLSKNLVQLNSLGKDGVLPWGEFLIRKLLFDVLRFIAPSAPWDGAQINDCAKEVYANYHWLSVGELKQFISRIKTGHYTNNHTFAPIIFMQWLMNYSHERLTNRYKHYSEQKPKQKLILKVENLQGNDRVMAEYLCAELDAKRKENMKRITALLEQAHQTIVVADRLTESEIKAQEAYDRECTMIQALEGPMILGYAPDTVMYKRYLIGLSRITAHKNRR